MAADRISGDQSRQRRGLKRFVKAAGGIVAAIILLDVIAGAATVWLGAEFLIR
jgi:hypothetical protein